MVKRDLDPKLFVGGGAKGGEREEPVSHRVQVEHAGHEAHLVFADIEEKLAPPAQSVFAQIATTIEIAAAGRIGVAQPLVVLGSAAGEPAADRPESL